jgi:sialidase-1
VIRFVATAFFCIGVQATAAEPTAKTLFNAGENGYASYRIPALVVTTKGTLLAFCEARKTVSDWADITILMRRSLDGGKTWSAPLDVGPTPTDVVRNAVAPKRRAGGMQGPTRNNPGPIADPAGPVHLVYCGEYARCFYRRSDDDGRTWSVPIEITKSFESFRKTYPWKVIATGPGHGIVISRGPKKGRLVIPVWLSTSTNGAHRPSVTATIYSDDAGKTWHAGDVAVHNAGDFINPNEASIVELSDGTVQLNVRTESKRHRRVIVVSADGAREWSEPRFVEDLVEPICFGSSVRFDADRILFANPDNLSVTGKKVIPGKGRDRKNLTLYTSSDGGKSWGSKRVLDSGPSGYSDLAVGKGREVYCLYEKNVKPATLVLLTLTLK